MVVALGQRGKASAGPAGLLRCWACWSDSGLRIVMAAPAARGSGLLLVLCNLKPNERSTPRRVREPVFMYIRNKALFLLFLLPVVAFVCFPTSGFRGSQASLPVAVLGVRFRFRLLGPLFILRLRFGVYLLVPGIRRFGVCLRLSTHCCIPTLRVQF